MYFLHQLITDMQQFVTNLKLVLENAEFTQCKNRKEVDAAATALAAIVNQWYKT